MSLQLGQGNQFVHKTHVRPWAREEGGLRSFP